MKRSLPNAEVGLINTYAIVQSNIPAGLRTAAAVALVRDLTSNFAKCDRQRSTPRSTVHGEVGKAARPRMRAQRSDKGTSGKRKYTRRGTLPQHAVGEKVLEKSIVNSTSLTLRR